ncbi:dipeptidyl peptidase IV N-terminal region-domain-containing protein [Staphylotrichum tortipilum]|uniref:Probable dipeptidyl-aminopeptidase B n=1 Tax=Staphylotrichum tortipilum TaxID=2831512 RepID=A0AAN6MDD1_9PEZI|nr:dipeptidyl peptidase IV N-terminal region-domain-containing protein [Staphylotrichum longicolle]
MRRVLYLCAAAVLAVAIEPPRYPHQPTGEGTKLLDYNITTANPGALSPSTKSVTWVESDHDGDFITKGDDGSFVFENVVSGNKTIFLSADKIPADYFDYQISTDRSRVLWAINYTKQYRHSYFADYLVTDVTTGKTESLVKDSKGDIQYATWNPVSSSQIAYVRENNLFIWEQGTTSQITKNGGPDMFNAIPDWVYEEEVFGSNNVLWYSPDGEYIAFLSFNETGVQTFTVPYYMDNQKVPPSYPRELKLRYPKVGTKNPTVALSLLDIKAKSLSPVTIEAWPAEDLIIGEVAWVTDGHDKLIYRAFNRVQDHEKLLVVDTQTKKSTLSRERDGSDGWLDNNLAITYIGPIKRKNGRADVTTNHDKSPKYYLDMSDATGWSHLYLFTLDGRANITLTSGPWEVTSILKVDTTRQLIHYTSTAHHPTERHLFTVSYATLKTTPLVDPSTPAVWSASFSASGGFYILRYAGPDVPYQELYSLAAPTKPLGTITSNAALVATLKSYRLPNITYLDLPHPAGTPLSAMLRLPASFSADKKYPLLLTPYGGPGAQEVSKSFQALNWKAYIASDPELEYITLTVDNRGTGFRGRAFRSVVAGRLGELEAQDQIWAAKHLAEKYPWVDAERMGIWGWSYGGYLTAKVVEAGGGEGGVIAFGMATAPVADWRLYDSVYTERYMKLLGGNAAGYEKSAVRRVEGFKGLRGGLLLQHGSGDDNVHFQNSAALGDLLMGGGVGPEKLDLAWFTDSDHSIRYHGQNAYVYKQLTKKLWEEKRREGKGGGHQWSKRGGEEVVEE